MASWYNIQDDFHRSNDNWWRKFLKGLNNAFNPYHAWFDYDKMAEPSVIDKALDSVGTLIDHVANPNILTSLVDKYTGAHLTGAENEANDFSAAEAQKSRDFTEYMARNKYSIETASMQDAGVNPAMVYGGGNLVPTAANGAQASSVTPQMGDIGNLIMSIIRMPAELAKIRSESIKARQEGNAAETNADANWMNAETNAKNAETNERNAATNERLATVQEMRQQVDADLAASNIKVNDEQATKIATEAAYLSAQTQQLDDYLRLEDLKVGAQQKQALASLQSALAAVKNAAVNEKLSDYQRSLYQAQAYLTWAEGDGREIVNKYLDDKQQLEIRQMNATRKLTDAETVRTVINCGTDVANTVARFIGINAVKDVGRGIQSTSDVNSFVKALNEKSLSQGLKNPGSQAVFEFSNMLK